MRLAAHRHKTWTLGVFSSAGQKVIVVDVAVGASHSQLPTFCVADALETIYKL
jgi:hypothetical protein